MLRKLFINQKKIPVPVPLRNLADSVHWIESTLIPSGHTITRILLDDKVIDLEMIKAKGRDLLIADDMKVDVQIDSPIDLAVQTLDALRNLSLVVASGLKMLAYECWKAKTPFKRGDLDALLGDINLMLELIDHGVGLTESMHLDTSPLSAIGILIKRTSTSLSLARSNSDLKGFARILLNQLEPILKDLVAESEALHIRVLTKPVTPLASTGSGAF